MRTIDYVTTELSTLFVDTLATKLADENTYFTRDDINCEWSEEGDLICWITDYDHIKYTLNISPEEDEDFRLTYGEYNLTIWDSFEERYTVYTSGNDIDDMIKRSAMILGYRIGTTY